MPFPVSQNHLCKASIQLILVREIINVYLDDAKLSSKFNNLLDTLKYETYCQSNLMEYSKTFFFPVLNWQTVLLKSWVSSLS